MEGGCTEWINIALVVLNNEKFSAVTTSCYLCKYHKFKKTPHRKMAIFFFCVKVNYNMLLPCCKYFNSLAPVGLLYGKLLYFLQ